MYIAKHTILLPFHYVHCKTHHSTPVSLCTLQRTPFYSRVIMYIVKHNNLLPFHYVHCKTHQPTPVSLCTLQKTPTYSRFIMYIAKHTNILVFHYVHCKTHQPTRVFFLCFLNYSLFIIAYTVETCNQPTRVSLCTVNWPTHSRFIMYSKLTNPLAFHYVQ